MSHPRFGPGYGAVITSVARSFLIPLVVILCLIVPHCVSGQDEPDHAAVDASIEKAIRFLVSRQQPSGGWSIDNYGGETTSATSLAIMALMASGYTPGEPQYRDVIRRGVDYVLAHQVENGMLIDRRGHGPMYDHGISTLMLSEVLGMVDEPQSQEVRQALVKAVQLLVRSQDVFKAPRHTGGWRYQIDSVDSDLSVSAWQLLALRAAKDVGCDVPAEAIDRAISYVKLCHDGRSGFAYQPEAGASAVMSWAGITALEVCGEHEAHESLLAATTWRQRPLSNDESWFYYGVYYSGVGAWKLGGETWQSVRPFLVRELLSRQNEDGSWLARQGTEQQAGPVYSTALAVLALTIDYGYLPIYQR